MSITKREKFNIGDRVIVNGFSGIWWKDYTAIIKKFLGFSKEHNDYKYEIIIIQREQIIIMSENNLDLDSAYYVEMRNKKIDDILEE